ncbi:putative bifunctional diguanylate cyclase/phosphodiesterase [Trichothermofontia sp.]
MPIDKNRENQRHFEREVYIDDRCFRQLVHYIYESDLIRSYLVEITDYKQAEAALRKSEAKNRALLDAIPDLMLHLNSSGIILDFKVPKEHPLQNSSTNFIGQNIYQILPTPAAQQMIRYVRRTLQTNRAEVFEYESLFDGSVLFYEARIITITQNEALAIIRNITDRKNVEKQLLYDALHDSLTGLPNRNLFMNRLSHAIELAKRRDDYLFAVLFIDLDRFKVINDSLGHIVGDQLLIAISRKLEACLRSGDTVARLGGDEFAILLEDINTVNDATALAERLQRELSVPFYLDHQEVFITLSVGIALSTTGYHLPEELLRDADTAMYHAKSLGRARYELFDQQMHDRAVALLQLDNDLRRAVERQEFVLYYQPIVCLMTGQITGFEALIRWQHPQRGLVPPDTFITLAEETGLIIPIGDWLLLEACQQAKRWQQQFPQLSPLTMSINLASQQFSQPNLVKKVGTILAETGIAPGTLNLEITEGTIMENIQLSREIFSALKQLNLKLCIDDFGTGYSSLSYLHRFPLDILKVDRSFVNSINPHADSHGETGIEITQTIIMLAHNLGLHVVAEGIETIEQLQYLRERNCEYGQGYWFSPPLPSDEVEALLTANPTW